MATSIGAILAVAASLWWAVDYLGVRPVIVRELQADEAKINDNFKTVQLTTEQNSQAILWLQYDNLSKKLDAIQQQGQRLAPKDVHDLCQVSKQLGIPPPEPIRGCPQ